METTRAIIETLQKEKRLKIKGGLYHKVMVDLTYNSNHIEGNHLTEDETRYIFETKTTGILQGPVPIDDIIETVNHFRAVDFIIDNPNATLDEAYIKKLHLILKSGTLQASDTEFAVGEYKKLPNIVGNIKTSLPEDVPNDIAKLLDYYNKPYPKDLDDILAFHVAFENIHPFQDGNGRVGRLIMFKECLCNNIVPFIILDRVKAYYYHGLQNWPSVKGFLYDTCLSGQDYFKSLCDYFRIEYKLSTPKTDDRSIKPKLR